MAPRYKDGEVVFAISGKWVSWAHTAVAYGESFKSYGLELY